MVPADVAAVHALERRLFPVDAWPLDMFSAELAQPVCWYWVAEQDGAIVGYAGLMCIRPVGDVQTIAVVPEHEGRGIGSALLRTLPKQLRRALVPVMLTGNTQVTANERFTRLAGAYGPILAGSSVK